MNQQEKNQANRFHEWRKTAIKRLPFLSQRVFNLRGCVYMGYGFHWILEKQLGNCIYDLQNFDKDPSFIKQVIMQTSFREMVKDINRIEQEIKNR